MKTKRILAIVLAVTMLASIVSVPAFAEEAVPVLISAPAGEGYICEDLGILIGPDEEGVTEDYLDSLATRTQAALVNLRLLGLESAALAFEGENTFEDAADATAYWQPILEYLKANPNIGWVGDDEGNFLPNSYITGQAFTKILLVTLGYEYGLYFDWETTMDFAAEVGLTALADKADADLTVRDLAMALVEALGMKTTLDTDITLISKLVHDGVIDEAAAIAAGFVVEEPSLLIINAYASSVNEVTVVMSTDVPEGTAVTLKRGTAGYSVGKTFEGGTVTLTTLFSLPAGTYTVTVGDDTAEFEVEARHAVDIVIGTDTIYDSGTQDLKVSLLDQYGDAMPLSGTNMSVFNQENGFVYSLDVSTTIKIDADEDMNPAPPNGVDNYTDSTEVDDVVYVFVYDPVSMLTMSGEISVIASPYLETLAVGAVTLGDEDAAMLFENEDDNILAVTAYDQYGQVMTLTDDMFTAAVPYDYTAEIQVLSSNGDVLDIGDIDIDGGKFYFDTGMPGTAMFTFIIPDQAFIVTSEMITVYADPEVASIEIAGPAEAVYADETVTFPVVGFDQYGNEIDVTDMEDIMFTTTYDLDTEIGIDADNIVYFYAEEDGTTTVYYFLNGVFQGTFDVTVYDEAYPFQVVGINDIPRAYLPLSYKIFSGTAVNVIDQYGRPIDISKYDGYELRMSSDEDGESFGWGALMEENSFEIYTLLEAEKGTDTVAFAIYSPVAGEVTPESAFTFDVTLVGMDDIASFKLDVVDDLILSESEYWDNYGQMMIYNIDNDGVEWNGMFYEYGPYYPYDSPMIFTGYLADGTPVQLFMDGYGIPGFVDLITFSIESPDFDFGTRPDYPLTTTIYDESGSEGECIVKVWIDGVAVASDTTEFSAEKPYITSITAADKEMTDEELFDLYEEELFFWTEIVLANGISEPEFDAILAEFFGVEFLIGQETIILMMSNFEIRDQYGVELHWFYLAMEGELIAVLSSQMNGDDYEVYLTIMTPGGTVYDSFKVTVEGGR